MLWRGTGKTFVTFAFQRFLKAERMNTVTAAYSAVTVRLPDYGRAAHSAFQELIPINQDSTCDVSTDSSSADDLRQRDLIVWDDIVMSHRNNLEASDTTLRDITRSDLPFRGRPLLLIGDFGHVLPVVCHENRFQIVSACVKLLHLYPLPKKLHLYENMRLPTSQRDGRAAGFALKFFLLLLGVVRGKLQSSSSESIHLPATILFVQKANKSIRSVSPDIKNRYCEALRLSQRAISTTRNVEHEILNDCVGALIPGETRL